MKWFFIKMRKILILKINDLKRDIIKINKISKNGRDKYFRTFNNLVISDSIISVI